MTKIIKEPRIDTKQLRGMIRERNTYRELLNKCVRVFNILPNQEFNDLPIENTYELVSTIEKNLNKFK